MISQMEDKDGNIETFYISAKDGRTIRNENNILQLFTSENEYLALWVDGVVEQWVCGSQDGTAQKFVVEDQHILDAMVKEGRLKDDNRKCVTAFTDTFEYGKEAKVILEIEESEG